MTCPNSTQFKTNLEELLVLDIHQLGSECIEDDRTRRQFRFTILLRGNNMFAFLRDSVLFLAFNISTHNINYQDT